MINSAKMLHYIVASIVHLSSNKRRTLAKAKLVSKVQSFLSYKFSVSRIELEMLIEIVKSFNE